MLFENIFIGFVVALFGFCWCVALTCALKKTGAKNTEEDSSTLPHYNIDGTPMLHGSSFDMGGNVYGSNHPA